MRMSVRSKLFLILFLAGLSGVLSLLLIDIEALIAILPIPDKSQIPEITPVIKVLSLIQPAVILGVAVVVGIALAQSVGLGSPAAEAAANGESVMPALGPQIIPGIVGGIIGGAAIVLTAAVGTPFLQPGVVDAVSEFQKLSPLPLRLLYGGITEEVLIRWGLMTLLVWAGYRLFQKGRSRPGTAIFAAAILISSLIFGIGHLPIAFLLVPEPTAPLILFVIIANSLFGFVAGFLYWKRGLESAIIAHITAHLVMYAANYLGAYF
jgi:hypothetical protein